MVHIVVQILAAGDEIVALKAEAGRVGWAWPSPAWLCQAGAISTTILWSAGCNVLPFDHIGHIIGVAHRCGEIEELGGAVRELQRRIYAT